jgi:FkbM family methyltransferase
MTDIFKKYISYYQMPFESIPRPQPSDFVVEYFNQQRNLFFVDIGAYDGITWSNSLTLEENYNWSGLCIEANPFAYQKLFKCRKNKKFNYALSDKEEEMTFWAISGYCEMLSGFVDLYDEKHVERVNSEVKKHGGYINKIIIKSKKLQTILDDSCVNKVDYLSIDTEGSELSILKGIDFSRVDIKLISVENNNYNNDVELFLSEKGYKKFIRVCGDDFYERIK